MSMYNIGNVNGPSNIGDHGHIEINHGFDLGTLLRLADQLVERTSMERPSLVPQAEIIRGELIQASQDGQSPNRGRIRSALETIGIGVAAGSGSLALAQEITGLLGL
jgi:hypothetical protein